MVFSTNQVRQLYVVEDTASKKTDPGYLEVCENVTKNNQVYFKNTNKLGQISRSDLIKKDNILWITATTPQESRVPIKSVKVTLSQDVNNGQPIVGQDYILNLYIRQYVGMSDTDVYIKQGVVRGLANMTDVQFYEALACSLFLNFKRELYPLLKFSIGGKEVTDVKRDKVTGKLTPCERNEQGELVAIAATADGVTITEAEQEWRLGVKSQTPVYFDVASTTVYYMGDEAIWGNVEDTTPEKADMNETNSYGNGRTIADLEYFCHGERGDIYRQIGWPHNIDTAYMVDPTKEYYTVTIHYYFVDGGESPQKSEKDITLVSTSASKLQEVIEKLEFEDAPTITAEEASEPAQLNEDWGIDAEGEGTPIEVVGDTPNSEEIAPKEEVDTEDIEIAEEIKIPVKEEVEAPETSEDDVISNILD